MNAITKVSEITYQDIADYLRISELTQDEITYLTTLIGVAKAYILSYTGIATLEALDNYPDMVIVVLVLCQDMYDNRAMYVDNSNVNKVVETVLGMHQINLL